MGQEFGKATQGNKNACFYKGVSFIIPGFAGVYTYQARSACTDSIQKNWFPRNMAVGLLVLRCILSASKLCFVPNGSLYIMMECKILYCLKLLKNRLVVAEDKLTRVYFPSVMNLES